MVLGKNIRLKEQPRAHRSKQKEGGFLVSLEAVG